MEIMNYWIGRLISIVSWQERLKKTVTSDAVIGMAHNNLSINYIFKKDLFKK